jgi:hypothetical protein
MVAAKEARDLCIDFAAGDDEPRGFNSELYQKWYESRNHAPLQSAGGRPAGIGGWTPGRNRRVGVPLQLLA